MQSKTPKRRKLATSRKTLPYDIPDELAIEILARLPAKPLLRLKCVCKSWFNLISNDVHFANKHLHFAKNVNRYKLFISVFPLLSLDHVALCYHHNLLTKELNFPILGVHPSHLSYIGSCNGLIAVSWLSEGLPDVHFTVWNPTTGYFRDFTASASLLSPISEKFLGFGYDSDHDDYKVVIIKYVYPSSSIKLDVFSLKSNKWTRSKDVRCDISLDDIIYTSSNGIMNWVVELEGNTVEKFGIVSFDLGKEKFLEMVPVPVQRFSGFKIQGVGDDVWLCKNAEWPEDHFEGWMMKRDGSEISWTQLYSFRKLPSREKDIEVIWVAKNGNVVFDVNGMKLVLYNPEDKSSRKYGVNANEFETPFSYMETLVSPKWCIQKPNQQPSLDKQYQA